MRAEAAVASEEDAPTPAEAPVIMLGPLEKSCVDELSDGVQSMDVRWDGLQDVFSRLGLFLYYMLTFTSVFQKNNSCFTVFLYMCAFNKCLSALLASFPHFIFILCCSWKHPKGLYGRKSLKWRKKDLSSGGNLTCSSTNYTSMETAFIQISFKTHIFIMTHLSVCEMTQYVI